MIGLSSIVVSQTPSRSAWYSPHPPMRSIIAALARRRLNRPRPNIYLRKKASASMNNVSYTATCKTTHLNEKMARAQAPPQPTPSHRDPHIPPPHPKPARLISSLNRSNICWLFGGRERCQ